MEKSADWKFGNGISSFSYLIEPLRWLAWAAGELEPSSEVMIWWPPLSCSYRAFSSFWIPSIIVSFARCVFKYLKCAGLYGLGCGTSVYSVKGRTKFWFSPTCYEPTEFLNVVAKSRPFKEIAAEGYFLFLTRRKSSWWSTDPAMARRFDNWEETRALYWFWMFRKPWLRNLES